MHVQEDVQHLDDDLVDRIISLDYEGPQPFLDAPCLTYSHGLSVSLPNFSQHAHSHHSLHRHAPYGLTL